MKRAALIAFAAIAVTGCSDVQGIVEDQIRNEVSERADRVENNVRNSLDVDNRINDARNSSRDYLDRANNSLDEAENSLRSR